jgi:adenosylcobinamide-GDP ribazoletransferase
MKASDTGPSGVAAVVLVLLLQSASLAALLPSTAGTALAVVAWLTSRHALAWACRVGLPAAQERGLGAMVAGTVRLPPLLLVTSVLAAVSALGVAVAQGDSTLPGGWWRGPCVLAVGLVAAAFLNRRCRRRLGGVTGDVLGAGVEVSLAAALVTAALLLPF